MSNSKNYNSIVFLTTLSVYLGLVLVGGVTPTVLAQAATTRNFNVQDEIEVKGDLDKKPHDESVEVSSAKEFPTLFIQLLNEVRAEVESGRYSTTVQIEFDFEKRCSRTGLRGAVRGGSIILDSDFDKFVGKAVYEKFQSKVSKIHDIVDGDVESWGIHIEVNNSDLLFKTSFTKLKAELFAEFLNQAFSSSAIQAKNVQIRQIYENSRATFENNQVFIVTRLPRGSLDSLLADKDAQ